MKKITPEEKIETRMEEKETTYSRYILETSILINEKLIKSIYIEDHYKLKHSSYLNDELILEIVKELKNRNFEHKNRGRTEDGKANWFSFTDDPIYHNGKAYKLVWYTEDDSKNSLLVINCHRSKKI